MRDDLQRACAARAGPAARGGWNMGITVGINAPFGFWEMSPDQRRLHVGDCVEAGVSRMFMADHVSFWGGHGVDGPVQLAAASQLAAGLEVEIGVYLLALRHPMVAARQISTLCTVADGPVSIGIGVGGEDRHEFEVCGIDPATRGRRTDESLGLVQRLLAGQTIDHEGDFYSLEQAIIRPAPRPMPLFVVGGRSDAALRRTARFGQGWLASWVTPGRFADAIASVEDQAATHGREVDQWHHGLQIWLGVGPDRATAREAVSTAMEDFYHLPFRVFEKYTPYGTVNGVAEQLQPWLDAGVTRLNLTVITGSPEGDLEGAGELAAQILG
ncbi:MAG: LLM class flavin-dependent oxidoreductase [Actinomycetia bacterium]|nr:LLM class flavin-dependent oxidoreductase [Actinomycetes bacterium]